MLHQVVVTIILFNLREKELQVLLLSSGKEYHLPSLFPLESESLEQAVARLVASLVDQRETHLQQLHVYGEADEPLKVVYLGILPAKASLVEKTSTWMPVNKSITLSPSETGVLKQALRRLRSQVSQGRLILSFLPREFTLGEVQGAYETILGGKMDKRNFRRQLLGSSVVEPTSRQRTGGGRPARLYRVRVAEKAVRK